MGMEIDKLILKFTVEMKKKIRRAKILLKNTVREGNSNTDYMIVIKTDSRSFGIQTEWTIQKDTQLYSPLLYNKGTHTVRWAWMVVPMCGPGGRGVTFIHSPNSIYKTLFQMDRTHKCER